MAMQIDHSQTRAFAASLDRAGTYVEKEVVNVVKRGAMNMKKQMNADFAASTHFKGAAGSVTFDMRGGSAFGGGVVEAEIGPDKGRRGGPLGNIAYFGTSRGGGTVPDPSVPLAAEVPRLEWALTGLLLKALGP